MALPCVRLVRLQSGAVYRLLCRSSSHQAATATVEIEVPRKKTWDKTAVLKALSYTVNHDPTSFLYNFQDDPFLTPRHIVHHVTYALSKESGKNAAKYIIKMYPKLFAKDIAVPHIPCLMPEELQPEIERISEEALNERIKLRRCKESVDIYDQLLQAGTPPSLETTNRLLDLLCFYGDKEPKEVIPANLNPQNQNESNQSADQPLTWSENNNAERIFNLMPEKDAHSFRTMIRGMVKHRAYNKAFEMYRELLNNRLTGDVHTFNALLLATSGLEYSTYERWNVSKSLINEMGQQKVRPNLFTFNSLLKSMKRSGLKGTAVQVMRDMKHYNIEPCLATYYHLMVLFHLPGNLAQQAEILENILKEIKGKSFTAQDPSDESFFKEAMVICANTKDLQLAYEVEALRNTGDNWKTFQDSSLLLFYYTCFFELMCQLENIDVVYKWYRENIPSRCSPNINSFLSFLRLIEMENRLELLSVTWKDTNLLHHLKKSNIVMEYLQIMVREKQNPQLQEEFAVIAADMKTMYESLNKLSIYQPSAKILGNISILLCRAGRLTEVWETLKLFKTHNFVPGIDVVDELMENVTASSNSSMAMDLVELAVSYGLPNTAELAQKALDALTFTEKQKIILQDLASNTGSSNSRRSSSSDCDKERDDLQTP